MQLAELMSGNFSISGNGNFQNGNLYIKAPLTLNCVNGAFRLISENATLDCSNVNASFNFNIVGSVNITNLIIQMSCSVSYGDYTGFTGMFGSF